MIPKTKMIKVNAKDCKIPCITLSGEWLTEAGFQSEDAAMVAIYKNTLIIHKVQAEDKA